MYGVFTGRWSGTATGAGVVRYGGNTIATGEIYAGTGARITQSSVGTAVKSPDRNGRKKNVPRYTQNGSFIITIVIVVVPIRAQSNSGICVTRNYGLAVVHSVRRKVH